MSALYWFALIVGAGLLVLSVFGDVLGHGDHGDGHVFDGGHEHGDGDGFRILSMRNATYFLFAFGAAGLLGGWAMGGERPILTALLALAVGLTGGAISAVAFGWLKRTETGYLADDRGWVGLVAEVVLPLSATGTGKVQVTRAGREHELLARPHEPGAASPEGWRSVLIVEFENGIALVSPYAGALDDPGVLSITPGRET